MERLPGRRWSGFQAEQYTKASTARSLANRNATIAAEQSDHDLINFNHWLEATTQGREDLAALYERRFRPEFRPAFAAWVASDPLNDTDAIASPLREPEYVLKRAVRAQRLEAVGDERFEAGREATENADDYVFVTVFFAIVLFFAGISLRFQWFPMRVTILALGGGLLLYATLYVFTLPRH